MGHPARLHRCEGLQRLERFQKNCGRFYRRFCDPSGVGAVCHPEPVVATATRSYHRLIYWQASGWPLQLRLGR